MSDTFTISFDRSNEDIPTLIVTKTFGFIEPKAEVINVLTGVTAEHIYKMLTKKAGKEIENDTDKN